MTFELLQYIIYNHNKLHENQIVLHHFCIRVYEYTLYLLASVRKKKVIDRIVVRSALTFALPDAFDFDVRKRAAYRWKAENLTFPTVCGASLYINSKGVKIWGKVGRKIVILLMLRCLSG